MKRVEERDIWSIFVDEWLKLQLKIKLACKSKCMDILNILKTIHYFFNDYKISIKFVHFHSNIDWFARERERKRGGGYETKGGKTIWKRKNFSIHAIVVSINNEEVLIHGNESYASPRSNLPTIREVVICRCMWHGYKSNWWRIACYACTYKLLRGNNIRTCIVALMTVLSIRGTTVPCERRIIERTRSFFAWEREREREYYASSLSLIWKFVGLI